MLFSRLFTLFCQRKTALERYGAALCDPYYPHDWPEAEAIAAEWREADPARREVLANEAETLLSVASGS